MTFKTWVKQFRGSYSNLGDLAGDIKLDKTFPSTTKFEKIAQYLNDKGACLEALETFAVAFLDYMEDNKIAKRLDAN